MSFHVPSQPKTASAVAQSIGVINASSSAHEESVEIDKVNTWPKPLDINVSENGGWLFIVESNK